MNGRIPTPIPEKSALVDWLQHGNRFRFWAACPELEGRCLRVVTLGDKVTIHNAFPDRGFKP
jgi:hypothetical protein